MVVRPSLLQCRRQQQLLVRIIGTRALVHRCLHAIKLRLLYPRTLAYTRFSDRLLRLVGPARTGPVQEAVTGERAEDRGRALLRWRLYRVLTFGL